MPELLPVDPAVEADYREGFTLVERTAAERERGEEPRPWDRVLYGIANVLNKRGFNVTSMDIATWWHYPTAMMDDRMPAAQVFTSMDYVLRTAAREIGEGTYDMSERHLQALMSEPYSPYAVPDDPYLSGDFDKDVETYIDMEIKRVFPKVRRKSKEYAKLHDKVLEQARGRIKERYGKAEEAKLRRLMGKYEHDVLPAMEDFRKTALGIRTKASHVRATLGDSEGVLAAEAFADVLDGRADRVAEYWQSKLAEAGTAR